MGIFKQALVWRQWAQKYREDWECREKGLNSLEWGVVEWVAVWDEEGEKGAGVGEEGWEWRCGEEKGERWQAYISNTASLATFIFLASHPLGSSPVFSSSSLSSTLLLLLLHLLFLLLFQLHSFHSVVLQFVRQPNKQTVIPVLMTNVTSIILVTTDCGNEKSKKAGNSEKGMKNL